MTEWHVEEKSGKGDGKVDDDQDRRGEESSRSCVVGGLCSARGTKGGKVVAMGQMCRCCWRDVGRRDAWLRLRLWRGRRSITPWEPLIIDGWSPVSRPLHRRLPPARWPGSLVTVYIRDGGSAADAPVVYLYRKPAGDRAFITDNWGRVERPACPAVGGPSRRHHRLSP